METLATPDIPVIEPGEAAALERLLTLAGTHDPEGSMSHGSTHQSMIVADFLLAWWDSVNCGHFDLTSLWAVEASIVADMQTVFGMIGRVRVYPDALGYEEKFESVLENWRKRDPSNL